MVVISRGNSKIGSIANISLTPIKSCSAAGQHCGKDCYARKSYRRYSRVRKAWDENLQQALHDPTNFFKEVDLKLNSYRKEFFRWHVAGDIPSAIYFSGMVWIAQRHPQVKFLAFTKQYSLVNQCVSRPQVDGETFPDNLQIVFSAWPTLEVDNPHNFPVAWMQDGTETRVPAAAMLCAGSCETCNMCWHLSSIGRDVVFHKH